MTSCVVVDVEHLAREASQTSGPIDIQAPLTSPLEPIAESSPLVIASPESPRSLEDDGDSLLNDTGSSGAPKWQRPPLCRSVTEGELMRRDGADSVSSWSNISSTLSTEPPADERRSEDSGLGTWDSEGVGKRIASLFSSITRSARQRPVVAPAPSTQSLILQARPANCPEKAPEEAARHEKLHEQLRRDTARREEQRVAEHARKVEKEERMVEEERRRATEWRAIIAAWPQASTNRRTHQLWSKGLPPAIRGDVWKLVIGNQLNITRHLYELYANQLKPHFLEKATDNHKAAQVQSIKLDVERTFPHLNFFKQDGVFHQPLLTLLSAYTCYRPDISYVQGMTYPAALLLLNMPEYDSFSCFANILNTPALLAFFSLNEELMDKCYTIFWDALASQLPLVLAHFKYHNLTSDIFVRTWFMTLFSQTLPLDTAARVFDLFLRDGDPFLFQTALGICSLFQHKILKMDDFESLIGFLLKPDSVLLAEAEGAALFWHVEKYSRIFPTRQQFAILLRT